VLSGDYATSIYQDREGNVWVGTAKGIDRLTKGAVAPAPVPSKFSDTAMTTGKDNDVWVGGLNGEVGRVHDNRWVPGATGFATFSAATDPSGGTWWAHSYFGYREINGHFTKFLLPRAYIFNIRPTRIALDRSGVLWLSGEPGIFARRNSQWETVDRPSGFAGKIPSLAYADAAGRIWFGYRENLILRIDGSVQHVFPHRIGWEWVRS